ncbi:unnamed protein product [Agarophyton chilense]
MNPQLGAAIDPNLYEDGVQLYIAFKENFERPDNLPFSINYTTARISKSLSRIALLHLNEARRAFHSSLPTLHWSRDLHYLAERAAFGLIGTTSMHPRIRNHYLRASSIYVKCNYPSVVSRQVMRVALDAGTAYDIDLESVYFRNSFGRRRRCSRAGIAVAILNEAVFVTIVVGPDEEQDRRR